jgi:hypothetical protein
MTISGLRPYKVIPPVDPPTIELTKPTTCEIQMEGNLIDGKETLSNVDVVSSIWTQRFGGLTTAFSYQIKRIQAWGPSAVDGQLTLTETKSFVKSTDSGTFVNRPRVGIGYPAAAQIVRSSSDATEPIFKLEGTGTDPINILVRVCVWGH